MGGIRSLIGFGNRVRSLARSVLYPRPLPYDASPKAISGRTSYFRVWLAFHPYPRLIQSIFNCHWFEPPFPFTGISPWPWIDHSVSGLLHATVRPIQTRFRFDCGPEALRLAAQSNSLAHYAIGTRSDCSLRNIVLPLIVGMRFQVLFHSSY